LNTAELANAPADSRLPQRVLHDCAQGLPSARAIASASRASAAASEMVFFTTVLMAAHSAGMN
jgi:hypothetical protein